jgi:hypothetical protein
LTLRAEVVMFDGAVGSGCIPGRFAGVFVSDAVGPGEVFVDLEEVVVAFYGGFGLDAAEEVVHAFAEFVVVAGDIATVSESVQKKSRMISGEDAPVVDLVKRHAQFILQTPEACQ